jgi:FAD/FMN-containing dehydrogenase
MTCPTPEPFLTQCQQIIGPAGVLSAEADMASYLLDWTGQYQGSAIAVLRPRSTEEVAQLVRLCAEAGIAVVPQGGRTGLAGGGVPLDGRSVVLSLERMNAIRTVDTDARTMTLEAGVILETAQNAALEQGLVFPLTFGAKGSCTIGGALATNAGGSNVVRYGTTRELCVGIEAVMPDGSVISALHGLRKDNTGYDLRHLLIGAEGTLGIITAAVFKLAPAPKVRVAGFLALEDLAHAPSLLNRMQDRTGGAVEAFEYMPAPIIAAIQRAFPDIRAPLDTLPETGIFFEVASSRDADAAEAEGGGSRLEEDVLGLLETLMEEGALPDAMIAQTEQQRLDLWHLRESALEGVMHNGPAYFTDISLPLNKIAPFVAEMDQAVGQMGFAPLTVGHLGDGNLHYTLSAAEGQDWDSLPLAKAKALIFDRLEQAGGSFSAEHGIGQSKLDLMRQLKTPAQLAAMRAVKRALDPENLMNPSKLIPLD